MKEDDDEENDNEEDGSSGTSEQRQLWKGDRERKDEQRGEIIKTLTERVTGNRRRQQRQKDSFTTTTTTKFHPKSADRRQLISAYPVAIRWTC